jgi:hypothetical protein
MLAADFSRVDCAMTLQRLYCLSVIEAGSRYVRIPGVTAHPGGPRTARQICNLLSDPGDHAAGFRLLVRDRAGQCTRIVRRGSARRGYRSREDSAPEPQGRTPMPNGSYSPPGRRSQTRC